MSTRKEVYAVIDGERDYQDSLGSDRVEGGSPSVHSVGEYITMLRTYANALDEAWTYNAGDFAALDIMRKIAGIAVHCMEDHVAIPRER